MPHSTVEKRREYRERNREHIRAYQRERYHRTKDMPGERLKRRSQRLKTRYDITQSEYDDLLDKQGGVCAVCGDNPTHDLRVDHDHESGAVRGLLCHRCNLGIGYVQDSPARARAMADYLEANAD